MTLSLLGPGGDARLSFTKDHIRVNWGETSRRERRAIKTLVSRARKAKFTVATVDKDGKSDLPARWRDLPGIFGKAKGEVLLQGPERAIQEIACELVKEEIRERSIVMRHQKDGSWKIVKEEDVAPEKMAEKETVESHRPLAGG